MILLLCWLVTCDLFLDCIRQESLQSFYSHQNAKMLSWRLESKMEKRCTKIKYFVCTDNMNSLWGDEKV